MVSRLTCLPPIVRPAAVTCSLALGLLFLATQPAPGSELRNTPIVRAIQSATPSIVNIRGEKTVAETSQDGDSDPARRVNGMGTGVVIDPRGYIVTNHHVVKGVRQILVTSVAGQEYVAGLIAHDPVTDLAIIKISPKSPMPVIKIGNSSDLMLGETVIAVGNAYGYENTVTQGIISQLHRAVQVSDAQFYEDLIQTDASINPGNSGGPLLNIDGEMVGLNVAVRAGAQGIGFAIPIDKVLGVVSKLVEEQAGCRRRYGIELDDKGSSNGAGLTVKAVYADSLGKQAGLDAGDCIVRVNDEIIRQPLDFHRTLLGRTGEETLQLLIDRNGESLELELALSGTSSGTGATSTDTQELAWNLLGVELEPVPTEVFRRKFRTRYRGGLTVQRVRPASPAAEQGILAGDILVGMHIWETITMKNVAYIMNRPDFDEFSPLKFYILRDNDVLYGHLPVSMKATQQR